MLFRPVPDKFRTFKFIYQTLDPDTPLIDLIDFPSMTPSNLIYSQKY